MPSITMTLYPAESAEFIMKNASFVKIRPEGIDALAKEVTTNTA